jgi:DNA invertase Pin-like site-specific DNA recombinase
MRIGIYCRISKNKEEGKDRSIDNQKALGIAKAEELGFDYSIYIDEGISGLSDKIEERPQFEKLLSDITSGILSAVFAFDQSRFERNPQVRFLINNIFKQYNISYFTHVDGKVDLFDPQSEFFGDIVSVINKYQVTMTKIKVKSVLKQRALEAKSHGIIPYGYTKDSNGYFVIDNEEAAIVKRIFDFSLNGIGTRTIASILNKEEVKTRYNKISKGTLTFENKYTKQKTTINKDDIKWSGNTIRHIIINPFYKGQRNYNGLIINVPAIIEPQYFDKVNSNLVNNRNNSGKKVVHRYLLKGLIRCGVCGRNMYGRARVSKKDYSYMCSSKRISANSCGNRSINIDKIENFIWFNLFSKDGFTERIESDFLQKGNLKETCRLESENLIKTISALSNEKQKAIDLTLKGIITDIELANLLRRIETQINESKIRLAEVNNTISNIETGEALISSYKHKYIEYTNLTSFIQKQRVVNEFIRNIVLTSIENRYYELKIEFRLPIEAEIWQTMDFSDSMFLRLENIEEGKEKAFGLLPPRISIPEDSTFQERFAKKLKRQGHI